MCISQMHAAKQPDLGRIGPVSNLAQKMQSSFGRKDFGKCSAKTNYMFRIAKGICDM